MPPAPLSSGELRDLKAHFAAIEGEGLDAVHALATRRTSAVFSTGTNVLDALALAWTGGKGKGPVDWTAFVEEFVGSDYVRLYSDLRNLANTKSRSSDAPTGAPSFVRAELGLQQTVAPAS